MAKKKVNQQAENNRKDTKPLEKKPVAEAHEQADRDIEQDPDLTTKPGKGDDLDEGELARLEGED